MKSEFCWFFLGALDAVVFVCLSAKWKCSTHIPGKLAEGEQTSGKRFRGTTSHAHTLKCKGKGRVRTRTDTPRCLPTPGWWDLGRIFSSGFAFSTTSMDYLSKMFKKSKKTCKGLVQCLVGGRCAEGC